MGTADCQLLSGARERDTSARARDRGRNVRPRDEVRRIRSERRKSVAERLGLGYEDLSKRNPDVLYSAATGYGPEGPDSHKPAFALARRGQARRGGRARKMGCPTTFRASRTRRAGIMLSYGILGALVAKESMR